MPDQIRETKLTLGGKTYLLRTALQPDQYAEIATFCRHLYNSLDPRADQENRLILGWLRMAYKLQQVEKQMNQLLAQLQTIAPEPEPEAEPAEEASNFEGQATAAQGTTNTTEKQEATQK